MSRKKRVHENILGFLSTGPSFLFVLCFPLETNASGSGSVSDHEKDEQVDCDDGVEAVTLVGSFHAFLFSRQQMD